MSSTYYSGVNPDLLSRIPLTANTVLEVGAGTGALGRAWRARQPLGRYIGIELFEEAAQKAREHLDVVIQGNIESEETLRQLDQVLQDRKADVLVLGDVLEHLMDPWGVLARLRERVLPGGICVTCIPNVAHWSLVLQMLQGRWDYADAGLLDRTHLRFFTEGTARRMIESAGWSVLDSTPRIFRPQETQTALKALLPAAQALGIDPERAQRDLSPLQWVFRAVNGPVGDTLSVAALGLKQLAGVTQVRVDQPLSALNTLPQVRAVWSSTQLQIPPGWVPGVLILHRQFMNDMNFNAAIERLIEKGWTIVADMDDDPHHWAQYERSQFRAFRGVHAVTVSTESLAHMMRQWNPNVEILPNAVESLPPIPQDSPKGQVPRIFFGALNRGPDWQPLREGLMGAAQELGDSVAWEVVHDQAFFDMLPADVPKTFLPMLPPSEYTRRLAACDINLLPLSDTPFNRLKSDLKFIESCAAGAVPVCSPIVYAQRPEHRAIGVFAQSGAEWATSLIRLCRDPDELAGRRELGLAYVREHRMQSQQVSRRLQILRGFVDRRAELERQRLERLRQMESMGLSGV